MIKKTINRDLKWINVEKEILNETCQRKVYLFGVKVWEHGFTVKHEGDTGKANKAGFNQFEKTKE